MREPVKVSCHCGTVELRVRLSDGLETARRCTCSYCARRGAIAVSAPLEDVEILRGAENLTLYTWGTHTAKHYFCSTCGIYTHHQRRSNPHEYGINLAAIEGVNPSDFGDVPWIDGRNHPSDRKN
ncbi:MAG: hypothetical protein ACJA2X_000060 [Halocynthiibacter sp.]|jgi:hypothetical protein